MMDRCFECHYNTNSFMCRPECGGCSGESNFRPKYKVLETENASLRSELENLRSAQVTHYCENCESVMKENTRLQSVVADLEFENAEITEMTKVMKRDCNELKSALSRYRTAEAEGRLVILPCKVGDTVYHTALIGCGIAECKVSGFYNLHCTIEIGITLCFMQTVLTASTYDFGKTVFLTRAEAENALKGEGK